MGRNLKHQLVQSLHFSAREAHDYLLADAGIIRSPRYSLVLELEFKCLPNLAGMHETRVNCDTESKNLVRTY